MTTESSRECGHIEDSEPADPESIDHYTRRDTRLAPPSLKTDRLPKPLVECGCGDCVLADPLTDSVTDDPTYAADVCPNPRPMTVNRAAEVYTRYVRASINSDERTSRYERATQTYGRLLEADRRMQQQYDGLTTVLLTRRLSPLDDNGDWLTAVTLDEQLHGGNVTRSMMDALRYQLDGFNYEYVGVTATTDSAATPHEHLLVWVDDPDDEIDVTHFQSALDKHVEKVPTAYSDDHPVADDGSHGAITVRHDPPVVDHVPEKVSNILDQSQTAEDGRVPANTAVAQYLASQLPHMVIGDVYDGSREVEQVRIDGGAIAWAATHNWLRSSNGISLQ